MLIAIANQQTLTHRHWNSIKPTFTIDYGCWPFQLIAMIVTCLMYYRQFATGYGHPQMMKQPPCSFSANLCCTQKHLCTVKHEAEQLHKKHLETLLNDAKAAN